MMIRSFAYDDRRLRDIGGEPLLATMVESAARCCGMGLVYEFWGVYEGRRDRVPKGFILQKGHALWATALCPEAVPEIVDFLRWRQEGWVMLCPALAPLWREENGEPEISLAVMALPDALPLPEGPVPKRGERSATLPQSSVESSPVRSLRLSIPPSEAKRRFISCSRLISIEKMSMAIFFCRTPRSTACETRLSAKNRNTNSRLENTI